MVGREGGESRAQHEEFALALRRTKERVNEVVEQSLFKRAVGFEREVEKVFVTGKRITMNEYFPPSVAVQRLWLQNRMPEVYRERTDRNER
jgi:hypothetical protein